MLNDETHFFLSGQAITDNSWCVIEPNDNDGNQREIMIDVNQGLCLRDGNKAWAMDYICAQGVYKLNLEHSGDFE